VYREVLTGFYYRPMPVKHSSFDCGFLLVDSFRHLNTYPRNCNCFETNLKVSVMWSTHRRGRVETIGEKK